MERETTKDLKLAKELTKLFKEVNDNVKMRQELIIEMRMLHGFVVVVEGVVFHSSILDREMEKVIAIMR